MYPMVMMMGSPYQKWCPKEHSQWSNQLHSTKNNKKKINNTKIGFRISLANALLVSLPQPVLVLFKREPRESNNGVCYAFMLRKKCRITPIIDDHSKYKPTNCIIKERLCDSNRLLIPTLVSLILILVVVPHESDARLNFISVSPFSIHTFICSILFIRYAFSSV